MTEEVRSSYPTMKLQFKFNQKLIWTLLKFLTTLPEPIATKLSEDITELTNIQTKIRKSFQSSPTTTNTPKEELGDATQKIALSDPDSSGKDIRDSTPKAKELKGEWTALRGSKGRSRLSVSNSPSNSFHSSASKVSKNG